MKNFHWLLVATLCVSGSAFAQSIDFGGQAESTRYMNRLQNTYSATNFKNTIIRQATTVRNGYGVATVSTPSYSDLTGRGGSAGPPQSQSASFGVASTTPDAKPFAAVSSRPTVSPYMQLFDDNSFGDDNDLTYQTRVQPQLQQRQFNEQVVREAQNVNRRLTALSARNAYNTTGNQNLMPTGHAAAFLNYSNFYPAKSRRRGR